MADPFPICHLNGEFLPLREARISPLDRSFLFGDGVYEVMPVYAGRPFRFEAHFDRLAHSCREIRMRDPHTRDAWRALVHSLLQRNDLLRSVDSYLYLQVSRGAEYGRNHAPLPAIAPTVFAYCAPWPTRPAAVRTQGVACITAEDSRWARCDIKSVALLANILHRQDALDAGCAETILVHDGELREASSSTVHVVLDGTVVTPPNSQHLLPGTTRGVVEEVMASLGLRHRTATVSEAELRRADEIWLAAATRELDAVTKLDGASVGAGIPGPLWTQVYAAFQEHKRQVASLPW